MTIDVATGIARILKAEDVTWVSTFPVNKVNNAFGREGLKLKTGKRRSSTRRWLSR